METSATFIKTSITSPSRKRKREGSDRHFQATQYDVESAVPITLAPVRWLDRAHIPLAWLKIQADESLPSGTLLNTHPPQDDDGPGPNGVLVVQFSLNGMLYALELVEEGRYICFALQPWITETRVTQAYEIQSKASGILLLNRVPANQKSSSVSGSVHRLPSPCSPKRPRNRRGAQARKSILPETGRSTMSPIISHTPIVDIIAKPVSNEQAPASVSPKSDQTPLISATRSLGSDLRDAIIVLDEGTQNVLPAQSDIADMAVSAVESEQLSPGEQFHRQYLETLYVSRTSLAYFAKGILGRMRNAFFEDKNLVSDVYRSCILPLKKFDFKYKTTITEMCQNLPATKASSRSKKKSAALKVAKNGLYTDEKDFVLKWWDSRPHHATSSISPSSQTAQVHAAVSELRIREAMMQILLILEISQTDTTPKQARSHISQDGTAQAEVPSSDKVTMPRPSQDVNPELEGLLDRLCIWQTIDVEITSASPQKDIDRGSSHPEVVKDKLRDFCSDVVLPFFATRASVACRLVCKRLGGPDLSPTRRQHIPGPSTKSRPTQSKHVNGRSAHAQCNPSLKRILSADLDSQRPSPPARSRSSSMSVPPNLKREASEVPQRPSSRGLLRKSVSFTNREVDLIGDARSQETKRKKLAQLTQQKEELAAAIETLRKPNRNRIGQSVMEDFERRAASGVDGLRRQAVQITATPKRGRNDNLTGTQQHNAEQRSHMSIEGRTKLIPSSSVKPAYPAIILASATPAPKRRAALVTIENTPSRPAKRPMLSEEATPMAGESLTLFNTTYPVVSTPSDGRLRPDCLDDGSQGKIGATPIRISEHPSPKRVRKAVLFTSLKKGDIPIKNVFRDAPLVTQEMERVMDRLMTAAPAGVETQNSPRKPSLSSQAVQEVSIYDSLGWNDDDEIA